jgi:TP901 family phage tail tape measure protein
VALSGDIANLVVQLRLDDSGFSNRLRGVQGSLGRFQGGLSQMGRGVGQVTSGIDRMATRAALAAAGGLTAVVTTAASFEQAFTGVEKTVDGTEEQMARLEQRFRQMARTMPVAFEELAAIGEAGGALGIAREDLEEFVDVVARLGVSTNLSSDQAATALGQLGNVLHLTGDEFRDLSDSLVALGNAGASTESQIVEMAARFAAAGNSAGLTKEEILALSSAVASMGIEVEAGGSALSRIFNNVATNIGTSSKKAVEFARTMGLTARQFKVAWERDALGTFQDFLAELGKLDQFEQARVLKAIGITNTRDISAVRLMSQNIGLVNEQLRISEEATGDLNKESQKFFDTTAGQWQKLKNNIRDAAATIGTELLPVVNDLIGDFTRLLNDPQMNEGELGKAFRQGIQPVSAFSREFKKFGQGLSEGIRNISKELRGTDFSGLIGGMKLAAQVAKDAFDAFRSLPEPIQQLAIAALVANKVSGGAVGSIAKGLANILAGSIKIAFPKLDIFSRGSPVNPMFVKVLGGLPGTGVPGTGGRPGAPRPSMVPRWLGPTIATTLVAMGGGGPMEGGEQIQYFRKLLGETQDVQDAINRSHVTLGNIYTAANDPAFRRGLTTDQLRAIDDLARQIGPVSATVEEQKPILKKVGFQLRNIEVETRGAKRVFAERLAGVRIEQRRVGQLVQAQRLATERGFIKANNALGIVARKDFEPSFNANIYTTVNAQLSTYNSLQTINRVDSIRYNGKLVPIGF